MNASSSVDILGVANTRVTLADIESAINRWRVRHPPVNFVNCPEVDRLANIYARMIIERQAERIVDSKDVQGLLD